MNDGRDQQSSSQLLCTVPESKASTKMLSHKFIAQKIAALIRFHGMSERTVEYKCCISNNGSIGAPVRESKHLL